MSKSDSQTTKLGPAAQKIADGLNDAIDGRYHTTKNDRRTPAAMCRERGWAAGTRLVADEGFGPTVMEITAIGEKSILGKTLSHNGEVLGWMGNEGMWALDCRDWQECK